MSRPGRHDTRPVNGRALWEARINLGLTQSEMAGRIRGDGSGPYMDDSRLSKIELGKGPWPGPRVRAAIARAYGLTPVQVIAPCGICGAGWTSACLDHGQEQPQDGKAA